MAKLRKKPKQQPNTFSTGSLGRGSSFVSSCENCKQPSSGAEQSSGLGFSVDYVIIPDHEMWLITLKAVKVSIFGCNHDLLPILTEGNKRRLVAQIRQSVLQNPIDADDISHQDFSDHPMYGGHVEQINDLMETLLLLGITTVQHHHHCELLNSRYPIANLKNNSHVHTS